MPNAATEEPHLLRKDYLPYWVVIPVAVSAIYLFGWAWKIFELIADRNCRYRYPWTGDWRKSMQTALVMIPLFAMVFIIPVLYVFGRAEAGMWILTIISIPFYHRGVSRLFWHD